MEIFRIDDETEALLFTPTDPDEKTEALINYLRGALGALEGG